MDDLQGDSPRRKVFNCIVDDTALVAGVKKTTRDGIRKWINHGAINLLVPLHTLTQLDRMKNGSDRLSAEAREAIRWLDDITSSPTPKEAGSVELQGVDECYTTWAEVEQYLLPETLLSMESDDISNLADSMDKSLSVKEDEEAMSSTDSLDVYSQSPSSRRSTNSSAEPDFSPASPKKWAHEQKSTEIETLPGSDTPVKKQSPVPIALQPLFNHILWRIHADPRAGFSMPDSYILLTNDPGKQAVAQKFGIRAKRLEQLRDIVAREDRDYKNRLLVLRKEATLSESELVARQKAKRLSSGSKESVKAIEEEEDEVVFQPRQNKPPQTQTRTPNGPKVFDPNTFGRAATAGMNANANAPPNRNSTHSNGSNSHTRGGAGSSSGRAGRAGFGHARAGRNTGRSSPVKTQRLPPVDLTQPIDPDSFVRPAPGARGGRGGRRRLWEAT